MSVCESRGSTSRKEELTPDVRVLLRLVVSRGNVESLSKESQISWKVLKMVANPFLSSALMQSANARRAERAVCVKREMRALETCRQCNDASTSRCLRLWNFRRRSILPTLASDGVGGSDISNSPSGSRSEGESFGIVLDETSSSFTSSSSGPLFGSHGRGCITPASVSGLHSVSTAIMERSKG